MGRLLGLFIFLKQKWDEPSSHAAICGVLALVAPQVDPGVMQDSITVAAIGFGGLGFFFKEQGPLTKV